MRYNHCDSARKNRFYWKCDSVQGRDCYNEDKSILRKHWFRYFHKSFLILHAMRLVVHLSMQWSKQDIVLGGEFQKFHFQYQD